MHPDVLAALINDIGIPATASRTAAIRQQVLEMSVPVVEEAPGCHRDATAKLASEAGGTWTRYAGDVLADSRGPGVPLHGDLYEDRLAAWRPSS
ncbi:hypothetical protein [Streptomyces sp. NPDC056707]|uniref:hypothetical protein n=1 Tax=Streptomyces TaxID=1883 RepID=UPI00346E6D41